MMASKSLEKSKFQDEMLKRFSVHRACSRKIPPFFRSTCMKGIKAESASLKSPALVETWGWHIALLLNMYCYSVIARDGWDVQNLLQVHLTLSSAIKLTKVANLIFWWRSVIRGLSPNPTRVFPFISKAQFFHIIFCKIKEVFWTVPQENYTHTMR